MIRSVYDIILKNYKLIANSCRVPTVAKNFKLSIGSIFISIKFDTKPIIRCLKDNPSSIWGFIRVFIGLKIKIEGRYRVSLFTHH